MKKTTTAKTLLKGEGANQHTLYGNFMVEEKMTDFADVIVKNKSVLKHEQPDGNWSKEHKSLEVEKGSWVMGKQVEYNPFNQSISQVWD